MIGLPKDCQSILDLADWLELSALSASDGNASAGDLLNAIQISVGSELAEKLMLDVLSEIDARRKAADEGYPFVLHYARMLQIKSDLTRCMPYIFCLYLSYFGWRQQANAAVNPRLLFEHLSCVAAKQYLQGEYVLFGTSRRILGVSGFAQAVNEPCSRLGEGVGIRSTNTLHKKDDHVDLVAWRDFKDGWESKVILFGQCASGENWPEKVFELQPDAFWGHWMAESKISPLCKSFFIPYRILYDDGEEWKYYARATRAVLFERCRIAYWAWTDYESIRGDQRYRAWCDSVLPIDWDAGSSDVDS